MCERTGGLDLHNRYEPNSEAHDPSDRHSAPEYEGHQFWGLVKELLNRKYIVNQCQYLDEKLE